MRDTRAAKIEAAGHAIYFAWNNTAYLREAAPPEEGECRAFAEAAVNAIDEISEPGVERLVAALRAVTQELELRERLYDDDRRAIDAAKQALAEFGQVPQTHTEADE